MFLVRADRHAAMPVLTHPLDALEVELPPPPSQPSTPQSTASSGAPLVAERRRRKKRREHLPVILQRDVVRVWGCPHF